MTDLVEALYCYAQENRVPKYLRLDNEYRSFMERASKCEERLRATLTKEQNERLDALLDERLNYISVEMDATFQAAFTMAMELSHL